MNGNRQDRTVAGKKKLGDAIERILIESGLSISAFSRKVGYSRQYIYELMKTEDAGLARKIQLDTLKRICDATGYSLERLLADLGYIARSEEDLAPNTVIVVKKNGVIESLHPGERGAKLIEEVAKSLAKNK